MKSCYSVHKKSIDTVRILKVLIRKYSPHVKHSYASDMWIIHSGCIVLRVHSVRFPHRLSHCYIIWQVKQSQMATHWIYMIQLINYFLCLVYVFEVFVYYWHTHYNHRSCSFMQIVIFRYYSKIQEQTIFQSQKVKF